MEKKLEILLTSKSFPAKFHKHRNDNLLMSSEIAIVTSTASDFPPEMAKELGVHLVDTYVHFGTETYRNADMTMEEFHKKVENSTKQSFPKTSQPSPQNFTETYEALKNQGYKTIISIHLSGKLSGTLNSANVAAGMLDGIDIKIVDTHGASFTVTACVLMALDMLKKKESPDKIVTKIEKIGSELCGYFTLETLDNLVKGGRMGKLRYRFGKLLNIKPVLRVGYNEIAPVDKTRGREASIERMYDLGTEKFTKGMKFKYIIAHGSLPDKASELEKRLKKEFPKCNGFIGEIGMAISVHAGKGALFILTYK